MQLADTLSRAYLPTNDQTPIDIEVESINMAQHVPISPDRMDDIRAHSQVDESLGFLAQVIQSGWPATKNEVPQEARPYFRCP